MRTKRLPPAPDSGSAARETVQTAREAVGRVPDPEADCCARIAAALSVERQTAQDWFTLLRALSLVERAGGAYRQTDGAVDGATLRDRFVSEAYGAREVLAALAGPEGPPRTVPAVVDAVPQPTWERHRHADPEAAWARHVERLLDWLVVLGAAERSEAGYRRATSGGEEETP